MPGLAHSLTATSLAHGRSQHLETYCMHRLAGSGYGGREMGRVAVPMVLRDRGGGADEREDKTIDKTQRLLPASLDRMSGMQGWFAFSVQWFSRPGNTVVPGAPRTQVCPGLRPAPNPTGFSVPSAEPGHMQHDHVLGAPSQFQGLAHTRASGSLAGNMTLASSTPGCPDLGSP